MKRLWMVCLTLPCLSFATGINRVDIKNLALDYQNGAGLFSFQSADIESGSFDLNFQDYRVDVSKTSDSFSLAKDDTQFKLKNIAGGVLDKTTNLQLRSGSLTYQKGQQLKLSAHGMAFDLGKGTQKLEGLTVNCQKLQSSGDPIDHLIAPCFENGQIRIPSFNLDDLSQKTVAEAFPLQEIIEEHGNGEHHVLALKKLKDIKVNIHSNNLSMTMYTRFILKLKVKIRGSAYLFLGDPSDESSRDKMVLTIHKAKVGFISIKKMILKTIRKANIKNLRVDGSRIILTL